MGVVNARVVKPLDRTLLLSHAACIPLIVTMEDHVLAGGFGSAVLEMLAEKNVTGVQVKRLGIPDEFVEHATQAQLRQKYGLDEEGIIRTIREMLA